MKNIPNKIYAYIKNNYKLIITDLLFIIGLYFLCFYKLPYYIYKPGGSINLNERLSIENQEKINGSYNMNYVSVAKGNVLNVLFSYFISNWDIVKEEDITLSDLDYETSFKVEQLEFENSIALANIIAFTKSGNNVNIFNSKKIIVNISDKAKTNIKSLDEVISIDDNNFTSNEEIRNYINSLNVNDRVNLKVKRDNKEVNAYAIIYEENNLKYMGISFLDKYDYETNPVIKLSKKNNEAGPSGGLMLTLTLYDLLSDDDLSKGRKIMGTGTIEADETVGAIGGVKYKLIGAQRSGADIFFVPKDNYEEALEVYNKNKLSFKLVCVEKLDDAINYLKNN